MPLTRSFNTTVRERANRDPAFRAALFGEAVQALLGGDLDTAKAALRAYINATIGLYQSRFMESPEIESERSDPSSY